MKKIITLITIFFLTGCSYFNDSNKVKLIPFLQNGKYGYLDTEGKVTIKPQFDQAFVFKEGIALVNIIGVKTKYGYVNGEKPKYGYINEEGKYIIPPKFDSATSFQEGIAWVLTDDGFPTAINKEGKELFKFKKSKQLRIFSNGYAAFTLDMEKWGFIDKEGKIVIEPQFTEVEDFYNNRCAVANKDYEWGFIDTTGKVVINYQFDYANNFKNDNTVVFVNHMAGVINQKGEYIINPQFSGCLIDGNKYIFIQNQNYENRYGWCDQDGKTLINPQFELVHPFGDSDLACVKTNRIYGYINQYGNYVINPQFDEASRFYGDIAIVKLGNNYGIINKKGEYVVNPQYEYLEKDLLDEMNSSSRLYRSRFDE
jgi:hypothetical protein